MKIAFGRRGRFASRWLRVEGREIHYRRSLGPDPANPLPVVLVHGLASGRYFLPLAERLAPNRRVYLPDLPGLGLSDRPAEPLGISALAEALHGWLKAARLQPAHLVGQSLGCNIAVEVGAREPAAVASITLQGVTVAPGLRNLGRLAPRWILNTLLEMGKPKPTKEGQGEMSKRQFLRLLQEMLQHPMEQRLPLIGSPALVLQGGRDAITPRHWAKAAAELLPRGSMVEIPRATHTMNGLSPATFANALGVFLADAERHSRGKPP